ncbi:hypothetical protein M0811_04116 [Anaeramoeba ignava]|uniref:PH domain-containing protein n=1 Tax=Anaeramoeba ignava TaxID=1746090 RepID=A0A9Q0LVG3_ANAIG|nr:hypothetical protein M0811_04116 [Anaeramoeba ignava]
MLINKITKKIKQKKEKEKEKLKEIKIIKSGYLTKQGDKHKNWKKRWFVLKDNATITYSKSESTQQNPLGIISLENTLFIQSKIKNTFQILHETRRAFLIQAPDKEVYEEWKQAINKSIELLDPDSKTRNIKVNYEGSMAKQETNRKWKTYYFRVFDNYIGYYQDPKEQNIPIGIIFLNRTTITVEYNTSQEKNVIKISHPIEEPVYIFPVDSEIQNDIKNSNKSFEEQKQNYNILLNEWANIISNLSKKCTLETETNYQTQNFDLINQKEKEKEKLKEIKIIKSGYLTKQGGSYKNWKKRWFVLKDNATITYSKSESTQQNPLGIISLENTLFIQSKIKNTFQILHETRRAFLIQAPDKEVYEEWKQAINKSIELLDPDSKTRNIKVNYEGFMAKQETNRKWKTYYFRVFDNYIGYYQDPKEQNIPIGIIFLNRTTITVEYNTSQEKKVIKISHPIVKAVVVFPVDSNNNSTLDRKKSTGTLIKSFEQQKQNYNILLNEWANVISNLSKKCTLETETKHKIKIYGSIQGNTKKEKENEQEKEKENENEEKNKKEKKSTTSSDISGISEDAQSQSETQSNITLSDPNISDSELQNKPIEKKGQVHKKAVYRLCKKSDSLLLANSGFLCMYKNSNINDPKNRKFKQFARKKKYWFYLEGAYLIYANSQKEIGSESSHSIPLQKAQIVSDLENDNPPFFLTVQLPTKKFLFECESKNELIIWTTSLISSIDRFYCLLKSFQNVQNKGFLSFQKAFGVKRSWNRKYFLIESENLYYFSLDKKNTSNPPDLTTRSPSGVICLKDADFFPIVPYLKKHFTFSIVAANKKKYYFFAENEVNHLEWIKAMNLAICKTDKSFNEDSSKTLPEKELEDLSVITNLSSLEISVMYKRFCVEYPKRFVTKTQFISLMKSLGVSQEKRSNTIFSACDNLSNGYLSFQQFIQVIFLFVNPSFEKRLEFCFRVFDQENQNKITFQNVWSVLCTLNDWNDFGSKNIYSFLEDLFSKIDVKQHGFLTLDDLKENQEKAKYLVKSLNFFNIV